MNVDIAANKAEFNRLLEQAGREGTDYLIEDLESLPAPVFTSSAMADWWNTRSTPAVQASCCARK